MTNPTYNDREMEGQFRQDQLMMILPVLVVALVVGVALALLFSPRGEDARREIAEAVEERLGRRDTTPDALKHLERSLTDLRDKVEEGFQQLRR